MKKHDKKKRFLPILLSIALLLSQTGFSVLAEEDQNLLGGGTKPTVTSEEPVQTEAAATPTPTLVPVEATEATETGGEPTNGDSTEPMPTIPAPTVPITPTEIPPEPTPTEEPAETPTESTETLTETPTEPSPTPSAEPTTTPTVIPSESPAEPSPIPMISSAPMAMRPMAAPQAPFRNQPTLTGKSGGETFRVSLECYFPKEGGTARITSDREGSNEVTVSYNPGEKLFVHVMPQEEYELANIRIDSPNVVPLVREDDNLYSFSVPEKNVVVIVEFMKKPPTNPPGGGGGFHVGFNCNIVGEGTARITSDREGLNEVTFSNTPGEKLFVHVMPQEEYELANISVEGPNVPLVREDDNLYSFLVPENNMTVVVTFVSKSGPVGPGIPTYNISKMPTTGGSFRITSDKAGKQDVTSAKANEPLYLYATPEPGYICGEPEFVPDYVTAEKISENVYSFSMPDAPLEVKAIFAPIPISYVSLTAEPASGTYPQEFTLRASLVNAEGKGISGQTITFKEIHSDGNASIIGTATTDESGEATLALSGKDAGTYKFKAEYAGIENQYTSGEASLEYTIQKGEQAELSLSGIPGTLTYGDNFTVKASGGSGTGNITYTSSNPLAAEVGASTGIVHLVGPGEFTITATQAGDSNYHEKSVTSNVLSVLPKTVSVKLKVADKQYDGTTAAAFDGEPTLEGVLTGDDVKLTYSGEKPAFASMAAGEGIPVTLPQFLLEGQDSSNYTLTQPTGITANIYNTYTAKNGIDYTVNSNDWLKEDFVIKAEAGFLLSFTDTAEGVWEEQFTISEETAAGECSFYVKNTETGAISLAAAEQYKIDKTAPVINGLEDGKEYCISADFTVTEKNLQEVQIDGSPATASEEGIYTLTPGEHTIFVADKAGNTAEIKVTLYETHVGGEATCTEKAICRLCQTEYGETDPANHTNLVKTEEKPATHLAAGNMAYWHCDGCAKYFSDEAGTKEISLEDTVLDKLLEHTPDETGWHTDEASHWKTCACGEILEKNTHEFQWITDKEATEEESGSRHEECGICGYQKDAVEIPVIVKPTTPPAEPTDTPVKPTVTPAEPTDTPKEPTVTPVEPTGTPTGTPAQTSPTPTEPGKDDSGQDTDKPSPTKPGVPNKDTDKSTPKTGDETNLAFWILLTLASGGVCVVLYSGSKKRNRNKK